MHIIKAAAGSIPFVCHAVEKEKIPIIEPTCKRLNIPYNFFDTVDWLKYMLNEAAPVLIFSAHNQYIFPKEITDKTNIRIVNFHNAYLPHYRGRNAPTWEIYNGESYGGATWHEVNASIDTGGIIIREKVEIKSDDIALTLLMRCAEIGINLLKQNVASIIDGEYTLFYPKERGRLYLSKDLPNNGFLEKSWDFETAHRFLRTMDYRGADILPLPKIAINDRLYEIYEYEVADCPKLGEDIFSIKAENQEKWLICKIKASD